jgi:fucose 4-O-acetylase-like acetyltransferase
MRNKAIDIEKGLGIILVALGHNWVIGQDNEELSRIIYSFHVPLFFFLSGVLFHSDAKFVDLLNQKWQSILKPYFAVLLGVALSVGLSEKIFPFENLLGVLFGTGQSILWTPMWFLPNLFVTVLFSWALISFLKLMEKTFRAHLTVFILMMTGIWVMNLFRHVSIGSLILIADKKYDLIGLPFSLDLIFISSAYFILGNIISDKIKNYKFSIYYLTLAFALFFASHYFFNESMNLNYRIYGDPILSTLQAICGIYLIVAFSEAVKDIRSIEVTLSYIGSGSLFVLIFHGMLQGKAISKFQTVFQNYGLISGIFGLIAGIGCSLIFWEVVKRIPIASEFLLPRREEVVKKN